MKRNNDLLLQILLELERSKLPGKILSPDQFLDFPDLRDEELAGHVDLLLKHGLIDGQHSRGGCMVKQITWSGHDFIGAARNHTIWQTAKQAAGHLAFSAFSSLLNRLSENAAVKACESILRGDVPEMP